MAKIILWDDFLHRRKKWISSFIVAVIMFTTAIGVLSFDRYLLLSRLDAKEQVAIHNSELMLKEEIYRILKPRGMSVGQALEVGQAVLEKSREKDIPADKILGIMKTESNMTVHARSHRGAMGLMQILPSTWDMYVKRLDLKLARQAAYDPYVNIMIAVEILSDLKELYTSRGVPEHKIWDYILSAYYSGVRATDRGISGDKKRYVLAVRKASEEYKR